MSKVTVRRRVSVTRRTRTIVYAICPHCRARCQRLSAGTRVRCYHCGRVFLM